LLRRAGTLWEAAGMKLDLTGTSLQRERKRRSEKQ
jgi:hypothetical protein